MTADAETRAESFYAGAVARIPRFMLVLALIFSAAAWWRFGWRSALGFGSAEAGSGGPYDWWGPFGYARRKSVNHFPLAFRMRLWLAKST